MTCTTCHNFRVVRHGADCIMSLHDPTPAQRATHRCRDCAPSPVMWAQSVTFRVPEEWVEVSNGTPVRFVEFSKVGRSKSLIVRAIDGSYTSYGAPRAGSSRRFAVWLQAAQEQAARLLGADTASELKYH